VPRDAVFCEPERRCSKPSLNISPADLWISRQFCGRLLKFLAWPVRAKLSGMSSNMLWKYRCEAPSVRSLSASGVRLRFPTLALGCEMIDSLNSLTDVTNAVLLDTLQGTLAELIRCRTEIGIKLDEHEFISAAESVVYAAMAAEGVVRDDEEMIRKAVLEELRMAFVAASRMAAPN
jgi:hypothetical protein